MSGSDVTINTRDGAMGGYLARPASGRGPGLVVIQDILRCAPISSGAWNRGSN
jgi:dienelactone hydrolase